jgi:hypothetical protein
MKLTIGERTQKVFQAISSAGRQTIREMAQRLGLSKSSVHRHRQAIARRNRYPESTVWETQAGKDWLKVLVLATLFIFCFQRGVGCESLHDFFRLLRLEQHIGVSVASLQKIRRQMEDQVLDYQRQRHSEFADTQGTTEICASVDETFFDQVVLVMLDASSGFIVVEELSQDYRYSTWQQHVQQALSQLGLKVRYCVSDRAKALVKLALSEMGCPSIADLFHALRELSQGIGRELADQLFRVHRRLSECAQSQDNPQQKQQLYTQQSALQTAQQQYRAIVCCLTTTLHPFAIDATMPQTSTGVQAQLQALTDALYHLKRTYSLSDKTGSIAKFERQLHDLSALVDLWWNWVCQCLNEQGCDASLSQWLKHALLPAVYWQQQTHRTKTPTLKATYQRAAEQAQAALMVHPLPSVLSADQRRQWQYWAIEMVSKFQRTSSAVEGRNGYLSQIHHNQRGLSTRRLRVMTTLHNFHLKRADGTTAAQRLFGKPVPDLFEWLVQHMPDLPQARRRKAASNATPFALPTVPA